MQSNLKASTLPVWDLSDLYPGQESTEMAADLARAAKEATRFKADFAGQLDKGDDRTAGARLAAALQRYEELEELLGRLMSYGSLVYAENMSDPEVSRFYARLREQLNDITAELLFFGLELNRIDDERMAAMLQDPGAAKYQAWLRDLRVMRPHQLADDLEALMHDKRIAARSAWIRLFDESLADLRFEIGGENLALEPALNLLSDTESSRRKEAAQVVGNVFSQNIRLFAHITNAAAKDHQVNGKWRHYTTPESDRHLANLVEPEIVEALRQAVCEAYPRLSHRYYALKAKWLGGDKLAYWDRNAPLPGADEEDISWAGARETVLQAYDRFSPELANIGKRFFDNAWIDAAPRPGKSPGAFAHPTVPSVHPYLLLNYQGKTRDVMTLAHELGHGVHQVLAGAQGLLLADTPLTLAETASVFGEQLTFRSLLENETDPGRKRLLLAGKVEDMLNTVVRQIAFYEFERRLHRARADGELGAAEIGEIWMAVQRESLGPAFEFDDNYANFWCYIPHFIHTPFYVYAYAFGDCLVNALYAVYQNGHEGFAGKYLDMLRAGGSLRHDALLAPFGLDARDPDFWQRGLSVIEGFIDQLEEDQPTIPGPGDGNGP